MNKYHEVIAQIDGQTEVLYGSFVREECVYEIEAEKESWKGEGYTYTSIKIVSRDTHESPDPEVYKGENI